MSKKLIAYLESENFKKIKDTEGYIFEGEEVQIEVLCVGRYYIVRVEYSIRFDRNEIVYYDFTSYNDVIDCIAFTLS